jgi:hypothetical protein
MVDTEKALETTIGKLGKGYKLAGWTFSGEVCESENAVLQEGNCELLPG